MSPPRVNAAPRRPTTSKNAPVVRPRCRDKPDWVSGNRGVTTPCARGHAAATPTTMSAAMKVRRTARMLVEIHSHYKAQIEIAATGWAWTTPIDAGYDRKMGSSGQSTNYHTTFFDYFARRLERFERRALQQG